MPLFRRLVSVYILFVSLCSFSFSSVWAIYSSYIWITPSATISLSVHWLKTVLSMIDVKIWCMCILSQRKWSLLLNTELFWCTIMTLNLPPFSVLLPKIFICFIYLLSGKPKVSLSFGPSYVEKNKNITLPTCHVTSYPPAEITWSKGIGELEQARAVSKHGQLTITNAKKKDSGLYKCKAKNILGYDSAVTHLSVVELPQFTVRPPEQLKEFTNHNITVTCKANGDTKPTVTWVRENGELPLGRSTVSVDGTLQIWNTKEEDSGRYTCTVTSAVVFKTFSVMKLSVTTGGRIFRVHSLLMYPFTCTYWFLLPARL